MDYLTSYVEIRVRFHTSSFLFQRFSAGQLTNRCSACVVYASCSIGTWSAFFSGRVLQGSFPFLALLAGVSFCALLIILTFDRVVFDVKYAVINANF